MSIHKIITNVCTLFGVLVFASTPISASESDQGKPLWQLGLGVGGLNQSYYTGTSQTRTFLFPVVIPIVRGKILKSDDEGARAEILNNEKVNLSINMDFNLAIDSEEIDLRQGMPDIANNLQIGPSLEWTLFKNKPSKNTGHTWSLNFPLRANFGFDDDGIDSDGGTFSPNIEYNYEFFAGKQPWRFGASIGPQFASSSYNDIYYSVAEEYSNELRPAYQAESGFSGYRAQTSMVMKNDKHLFVLFLRYENIASAVFNDSPLVETEDNIIGGFFYNYYFFNSKTIVNR